MILLHCSSNQMPAFQHNICDAALRATNPLARFARDLRRLHILNERMVNSKTKLWTEHPYTYYTTFHVVVIAVETFVSCAKKYCDRDLGDMSATNVAKTIYCASCMGSRVCDPNSAPGLSGIHTTVYY